MQGGACQFLIDNGKIDQGSSHLDCYFDQLVIVEPISVKIYPHALKMMGKHILSKKNILYYMAVFMYGHIEIPLVNAW